MPLPSRRHSAPRSPRSSRFAAPVALLFALVPANGPLGCGGKIGDTAGSMDDEDRAEGAGATSGSPDPAGAAWPLCSSLVLSPTPNGPCRTEGRVGRLPTRRPARRTASFARMVRGRHEVARRLPSAAPPRPSHASRFAPITPPPTAMPATPRPPSPTRFVLSRSSVAALSSPSSAPRGVGWAESARAVPARTARHRPGRFARTTARAASIQTPRRVRSSAPARTATGKPRLWSGVEWSGGEGRGVRAPQRRVPAGAPRRG
jgi:hypothetical protein